MILGMIFIPLNSFAQDIKDEEETLDDLGVVTDRFQDHFFEALKQKGIENYDRALRALEKAAQESPNEIAVYYEMAKNYGHLEQWERAEANYKKVLQMEPGRIEAYEGLYGVYYNTNDYQKAIEVVQKLIPFDREYKEDLANLYERTEQYEKALQILDELDLELGHNEYRNQLRQQIYVKSDNTQSQISDLENRINRTPVNEQDFLNLIFLYSEQNNTQAAFETAQKLIKVNPNADVAHLALYKFYLEQGKTTESLNSMRKVFSSDKIDMDSKFKVLNDFLLFVNENPQFENELENMVTLFSKKSKNAKVFQQLGDYYLNKQMNEEALNYYELGLKNDSGNFELIRKTALLQIETKKFSEAAKLTQSSLDLFPSQPILYLLNGVANLNLNNTSRAKTMFETGLDYLIDDPQMERDFYLQLSKAFEKEGNTQRAGVYLDRANKITVNN
jgi:tetratricopeptide (TPR) repeat protein